MKHIFAQGTHGQIPEISAPTGELMSERLIVGEEWSTLSSCRTTVDDYLCYNERTSVSVAIALKAGICTATVKYVDCLEGSCTSSQALTESIKRIHDRCQGYSIKSTTTSTTQVPTSATRSTTITTPPPTVAPSRASPTKQSPTSTTSRPSPTGEVPTSTTSRPSPTGEVPTSTTSRPSPTGEVPTSTTSRPSPTGEVPTSTPSRASPSTQPLTSTASRASPTREVPTLTTRISSTQVYPRVIISETDLVDNEWSTLTTCRFLGADDVCDVVKKTLQSFLIIESGVCKAAIDYVNCLETNCHSSSDLDASVQRIRDRCNGQATVGQATNRPAAPSTASTRPPTTQKTTTQIAESDLLVAEWNTLASCHLVDDEGETCDNAKKQLQYSITSEYGVCASAIDYVDCLENVCLITYTLTNSISKVRTRCNGYISNGQVTTSNPNTQVSESDLIVNEWHALTTCTSNGGDEEEEESEECADAKTALQTALKIDFGICQAAISFVDCVDTTCRHTHTLTDSIARVRAGCNGVVSQPGTGAPGTIASDATVVNNELHTLTSCILLDPEEEDCGEAKTDLQDALKTNSEVCEAASGYVECLEGACLITHTLTESFNRVKTRCDEAVEDPEENPPVNLPGTQGSEYTVVNAELHTLTTCALLDPEEEDCGEGKTDLQDALRSNEGICEAALGLAECLEEACLMTHTLTDSLTRIRNRCEEEEDD